MSASRKPRLFIGSSTESLRVARDIQELMDYDAECTVWTQGIFRPTRQALGELAAAMRRMDFAVFVFAPDDILKIRGTEHPAVRDNVIFELGLFMGHLGPDRCFMVAPRGAHDLRLPSDLLGLGVLTFEANRSDGSQIAALGSPCNALLRAMEQTSRSGPASAPTEPRIESAKEKLSRLTQLWTSSAVEADRGILRKGMPWSVAEDETGEPTAALERIMAMLNSVADVVLHHPELETEARGVFGKAIVSVWSLAYTYFSPPSAIPAEIWGDDLPPIAVVANRWRHDS